MVILTMLAAWLTMVVATGTPIGRLLRSIMVERPAMWLDRIRRGHVLLAALALPIVGAAIYWGGADAARMLSMATPEFAAWAAMFDIATYLDVAMVVAITTATVRVRVFVGHAVARSRKGRGRPGTRRAKRRRTKPARPADNDDNGRPFRIAA